MGATTPDQEQGPGDTGGWLEGCHGNMSNEVHLIKGSYRMKGGKLTEPVP